ncbi:hypothetical protein EKO27_g2457 [Xylaria grammica]|uniref:Uncharacterized protein n=1 Tax=Xylaria grammica TaxID=363999 RepID=A0A439DDZ4_9PEZI|nr:hypothetical protein EKO27_g2457 [Xylaria grammica]
MSVMSKVTREHVPLRQNTPHPFNPQLEILPSALQSAVQPSLPLYRRRHTSSTPLGFAKPIPLVSAIMSPKEVAGRLDANHFVATANLWESFLRKPEMDWGSIAERAGFANACATQAHWEVV